MKLSNLKTWLPGMILGLSLLAAVPVSADITNSGSTPPPIKTSKLSSTNDAATDSQNSDDSGKVYDFKDSKTSGVVTVTKTWDDSISNDERSVPDVTISTERYRKNPLGYTITYHGNGLTFPDGSTENEILVNSAGQIISGQYKEIASSAGWFSDNKLSSKVKVSEAGIPDGISCDMDLYATGKTFVIKAGPNFNKLIPSSATSVEFSDEIMPASTPLIDVDADGDGSVVAWMDGTVMIVSSQIPGQNVIAASSCYELFYRKSNLTSIKMSNFDTSKVNSMESMFYGCSKLRSLDLTPLDTSSCTDMSGMFYGCSKLTDLNLTSLNTSNVNSMNNMFGSCSKIAGFDLTSFDTHNVTNMSFMFSDCSALIWLNLSPFSTDNVINMDGMFYSCSTLIDLELSSFNTANVKSMDRMFYGCSKLTDLDLSSFNTSNVTNMSAIFRGCSRLKELDLSSFNTGMLQKATGMFGGCSSLTTLDLSMLDFKNVYQVSDMTKQGGSYGAMFDNCSSLVSLKLPQFSDIITNFSDMFCNCSSLTSLDLSSMNTSRALYMSDMFDGCRSLTSLDLSSFETSHVREMSYMFAFCDKLTSLNMSSFDTGRVTDMNGIFQSSHNLANLTIGENFVFVGSEYNLPSGTWYASDGTAYTSDGTTCTIPSNKADTYTRR